MIEKLKKILEKILGNPIVSAVISIGALIFIIFGSYFTSSLSLAVMGVLVSIYFLSLVTGVFVGSYILKSLDVEIINKSIDRLEGLTSKFSKWEYEGLVVNEKDYWPNKEIKQLTVFGVNFSLTGGRDEPSKKERQRLLDLLKNENIKVIYICTKSVEDDYELIPKYITYFLEEIRKEKNFKEIKEKIEIYTSRENPLRARVVLIERFDGHRLALYKLGSFGSEKLESKIGDLAIKIDEEKALDRLYQIIDEVKNKSGPGVIENLGKS